MYEQIKLSIAVDILTRKRYGGKVGIVSKESGADIHLGFWRAVAWNFNHDYFTVKIFRYEVTNGVIGRPMPHILVSLVGSGIAVAPCVLLVRPPRIQHGQEYPPSEHDAHANSHPKKPVGTASLFRRRFVMDDKPSVSLLNDLLPVCGCVPTC